jgi:alpha(1,3/1,4) fucosyltransferase
MRDILIHIPDFSDGRLFAPARDQCHEPFVRLRDRLRDIGYELKTSDSHPIATAHRILFFDLPIEARRHKGLWSRRGRERNLLQECLEHDLQDRLALLLIEPPVVHPQNWDVERHKPFPTIFTWSDALVDGTRYLKLHEPVPSEIPAPPHVPFSARTLLIAISGNKRSSHPAELYSARRAAIRYFSRVAPNDFHLYGYGWRFWERPRSFRGIVRNKWEVLPNYRFGICYENVRGFDGCVSERIFDCLRSRCIPVYWGAPNIDQYVDRHCFIDRTQYSSEDDLLRFLRDMSEAEFTRRLDAIDSYLRSERFRKFLPDAYADTIISGLKLQPVEVER